MREEHGRLLAGTRWAMDEAAFTRMIEALGQPETLRAARHDTARKASTASTIGFAIIPIFGVMEYRLSWIAALFGGGTSTFDLIQAVRDQRLNKDTTGIVLHVDSPGGEVTGMEELAEEIRRAAQAKPVIAVVDGLAASAAYSATSQASEIWASPSSEVGSIGVFAVHFDESGALERRGVKPTIISAGKFKTEANPFEPLADSARAEMKRRVDEVYAQFVRDVARGRRVSDSQVRENYGQGRVVTAAQAQRRGMIDQVRSYHDSMAVMHGVMQSRAGVMRAQRDVDQLRINAVLRRVREANARHGIT